MNTYSDPMDRFDFLLGDWQMEYMSPIRGSATGTFRRALDGKYVFFDYAGESIDGETGAAHGVFAWDRNARCYRYWWFEDSGNYSEATCKFVDDGLLLMSWHDSLFVQTFRRLGPEKVELIMKEPQAVAGHDPILKVIFTK
jgi:hypothetical protein